MFKYALAVFAFLPSMLSAADTGGLSGASGASGTTVSGGGGGGPNDGGMSMLYMLPLVIGLMYFIVIRPQRREEKKKKELIAAIKKGDQVVTIGGIHGEVVVVGETTIDLRVGQEDGTVMRFSKGAVASIPTEAKAN